MASPRKKSKLGSNWDFLRKTSFSVFSAKHLLSYINIKWPDCRLEVSDNQFGSIVGQSWEYCISNFLFINRVTCSHMSSVRTQCKSCDDIDLERE